MVAAMQRRSDRERRLSECRCPIHGTGMVQVGLQGTQFLVACPRRDCDIQGASTNAAGPVSLLPEHQHLLAREHP